jgi:uncharacterized protein YjaZ
MIVETILITTLFIVILYQLYKSSHQSLQAEQEEDESPAVYVRVEKYGDQIYFWDKDTSDFIAQGKDLKEIVSKCEKLYPNFYFHIEKEDVDKYNLKVDEATVA